MKCPDCGSKNYSIYGDDTVRMSYEKNTLTICEPTGNPEWKANDPASCDECEWEGKATDLISTDT